MILLTSSYRFKYINNTRLIVGVVSFCLFTILDKNLYTIFLTYIFEENYIFTSRLLFYIIIITMYITFLVCIIIHLINRTNYTL